LNLDSVLKLTLSDILFQLQIVSGVRIRLFGLRLAERRENHRSTATPIFRPIRR